MATDLCLRLLSSNELNERCLIILPGRSKSLSIIMGALRDLLHRKRQDERNANLKKAEESLQEDLFLQQLQQEFSAEMVKGSIESL